MSGPAPGTLLRHLRGLAALHQSPSLDDRELLHAFIARHDEAAFAALVQRHGALVLGVCRRVLHHVHDAEDAFQATFLVLAQNATAIRKRESLACWLHGVAYRMALHVQRGAARRQIHERQARSVPPPEPLAELSWREVQAALEEEIQRLPKRYRKPFVLCCLEGQSCAMVAQQLGVKEGTVWSRLAEARRRLRQRLARRGLELAALLAAVGIAHTGTAAVSPSLARATTHAAVAPAGSGASAHVLALVQEATTTLFTTRLKVAAALLIALGALASAATYFRGPATAAEGADEPGRVEAQAPGVSPKLAEASLDDGRDPIVVGGRVLDPDGKPISSAHLYVLDAPVRERRAERRASTAESGTFRFAVPRSDVYLQQPYNWTSPWDTVFLLAAAEGYGPAVVPIRDACRGDEATLRLARDDVAIEGRIVGLEGQPLPGITVRLRELLLPERDLTEWLDGIAKDGTEAATEGLLTRVDSPRLASLFSAVQTDRDGRFRLRGMGRERVAVLTIEGPTIATERLGAMTRPGKAVSLPDFSQGGPARAFPCYGARFDHPTAPTRPVAGVIRDKDTGKPLAGVTVAGVSCQTTTDQDGRYRLVGLPRKGGSIRVTPADGQPYLATVGEVPDRPGLDPFPLNFDLKRGVRLWGRLTDQVTGKPVAGAVEYFVFEENPNRAGAGPLPMGSRTVGEDGSFELVGFPGRGIVAAQAWGDRYLVAVGADRIQGADRNGNFSTFPSICQPCGYHRLVEIRPAPDTESLRVDLTADPGRTVVGTVLDPDGKPLAGALAFGLRFNDHGPYWDAGPQETPRFTAHGLRPGERRKVVFLHQEKHLAGAVVITGEEKGQVAVPLRPWGSVSGRLVDANGQPRPGVALGFPYGAWTGPDAGTHPETFQTDTAGRFRIDGLVPGFKYRLGLVQGGGEVTGHVFRDLTVKPGEIRELGNLQFQPQE
jgi:RNA polymerase sigma factor (sigma-70 family)